MYVNEVSEGILSLGRIIKRRKGLRLNSEKVLSFIHWGDTIILESVSHLDIYWLGFDKANFTYTEKKKEKESNNR